MIFYSTPRVTLGGSVGEEVVNQRGHGSRMTKCAVIGSLVDPTA